MQDALKQMLAYPKGIYSSNRKGQRYAPWQSVEALRRAGLAECIWEPFGLDRYVITEAGREVMK